MSLETEIAKLTAAVVTLTAKLEQASVAPAKVETESVKANEPAAPVAAAEPEPQDVVVEEVAEPQPVVSDAPFADANGMKQYIMNSYKQLGPEKGVQIQTVLNGLGYQNINDVKPEHFGALFQGVEALK